MSRATLLAAAVLTLLSCRGIYLPEPDPDPPPTAQTLIVDVIPPEGVEISHLEIRHDNGLWIGSADSLRRSGTERVDAAGERLVLDGLVEGPTLLEYVWQGPGGESFFGTWGVVQVPGPPVEVDLRGGNTVVRADWSVEGESQPLERLILDLVRRFDGVRLSDSFYAPQGTVRTHVMPGNWAPNLRWEFPRDSPISSASSDVVDSLVAPGTHDLGPDLSRIWFAPRVGGSRLSNAEIRLSLEIPRWSRYEDFRVGYRPQFLEGQPLPLVWASRTFQLRVEPHGTSPFPSRWLWLEAEAGDTLRVDLAEHRVELRVHRASQPVAFLEVRFDSQRLDTGGVSLTTDEEGSARLWLPEGVYRLRIEAPHLALVGNELVEVSSDTLLVRELEAP